MEDIIDSLRAAAQPQIVPLTLPDDDRLVEIEEEILLPIPMAVKQFLLTVSDIVCGSIEPVTATDSQAHTYLPEVTAQAWADGLPRSHLPICQIRNNYYCVDTNGEVLYWENGCFSKKTWPDIWQWAKAIWLGS